MYFAPLATTTFDGDVDSASLHKDNGTITFFASALHIIYSMFASFLYILFDDLLPHNKTLQSRAKTGGGGRNVFNCVFFFSLKKKKGMFIFWFVHHHPQYTNSFARAIIKARMS